MEEAKIILDDLFELRCCEVDLNKSLELISRLQELFENDSTTVDIVEIFKYFFNLITSRSAETSRAIWDILHVVDLDDDKISAIIKRIFTSETNKKIEMILCMFINATCLYTDSVFKLVLWAASMLEYLEKEKNYCVLLNVSQYAIKPLLRAQQDAALIKFTHYMTLLVLSDGVSYETFVSRLEYEVVGALSKFKGDEEEYAMLDYCIWQVISRVLLAYPDFFDIEGRTSKLRLPANYKQLNKIKKPSWFSFDFKASDSEEIIKCYNCFDRYGAKIFFCKLGHPICNNCKNEVKCCTVCSNIIPQTSSNKMFNKVFESIKFSCKYINFGCNQKVSQKELENHESECRYETEFCDLVIDHLKNETERPCLQLVVKKDFKRHIEKCHRQLITDFNLGMKIKSKINWDSDVQVRIFKDFSSNKLFMERVILNYNKPIEEDETENENKSQNLKGEFWLGCYYLGSLDEEENYDYMFDLEFEGKTQKKLTYSGTCYEHFVPEKRDEEKLLFKHFTMRNRFGGLGKVANYNLTITSVKRETEDMEVEILDD